jgi:uncharacterized UPF0160 family protein
LTGADLQEVTGVADAVLTHRSLFFAVARFKEGARALAELAIQYGHVDQD